MAWMAYHASEPRLDHERIVELWEDDIPKARLQRSGDGGVELVIYVERTVIPAQWLVEVMREYGRGLGVSVD